MSSSSSPLTPIRAHLLLRPLSSETSSSETNEPTCPGCSRCIPSASPNKMIRSYTNTWVCAMGDQRPEGWLGIQSKKE